MKLSLFFSTFWLALGASLLPAGEVYKVPQQAVIELRAAAVPPDWQTNNTLPQPSTPASPTAPTRFVTARKENAIYQRLDFRQGASEEAWWIDGWLGWKDRTGQLFLFDTSKPIVDGPHPGFFVKPPALPGLDWVTAESLISKPKKKAAADTAYRYYATAGDGGGSPVRRAWVDAVSGVPIAAQRGRLFFVYRFENTVSAPDFPAELAEKLKAQKKINSFIETMRKRRNS